jgi:hypothetical protein
VTTPAQTAVQTYGPKPRPLADRFWKMVNKDGPIPAHMPELGPCWLWTGATNEGGYGEFAVSRSRAVVASRVAWFLECGEYPKNLACHHCDNPPCVRFSHLYDGTYSQNNHDTARRGKHYEVQKTHCPSGHPYSGNNLAVYPTSKGGVGRFCRTCYRVRQKLRTPEQRRQEYLRRKARTQEGARIHD